MKKQIKSYQYVRYEGKVLKARREISYEIKLSSRLILDELCFQWNKNKLATAVNRSIDQGDKQTFLKLSEAYRVYLFR